MSTADFFDESTEQSRIKTRIVSKYFTAWAQVVVPPTKDRGGDRVAFIDLFAGPGRYGDEVPSTPLRVLGSAVKNEDLRDMLVPIFNDRDPKHVDSLREAIASRRARLEAVLGQVLDEVDRQIEELRGERRG